MKQYLIILAMLLTLATTTQAAAQRHRHSSKSTPVANTQTPSPNTQQPDTAGVEAFSDTTSVAAQDSLMNQQPAHYNFHYTTDWDSIADIMEGIGAGLVWAIFALIALLILFVLAPVVIIIAIFYFINKSRKDKLKLAQMAVMHGQPIPEQLIQKPVTPNSITRNNFRSGVKQMFLGIGLFIMLGLIFGKLGYGIGALIFFIGLGKLVIATIDKENEKKVYNIPYQYAANEQQKPADNGTQKPTENGTQTPPPTQTTQQTPPPYNNEKTEEKEN